MASLAFVDVSVGKQIFNYFEKISFRGLIVPRASVHSKGIRYILNYSYYICYIFTYAHTENG